MSGETVGLSVSLLATEEGVTEAAARIAVQVAKDILHPVWEHMPPEMRPMFLERLMSGMVGAACGEFGPERTKLVLEAVKDALDEVVAKRGRARAH